MISIALVGLGVVWQNMVPASLWGWVAIGAGLGLGIATRQIQPSRTPLEVIWCARCGCVRNGVGRTMWRSAMRHAPRARRRR